MEHVFYFTENYHEYMCRRDIGGGGGQENSLKLSQDPVQSFSKTENLIGTVVSEILTNKLIALLFIYSKLATVPLAFTGFVF